MGGAPGLHPLFRHGEGSGNLVQLLGDENKLEGFPVDGFDPGIFLLDSLLHLGLERLPDDIDNLAESGLHGIVDAVVDDGFSVGTQAVHLLEAAVTAAHTGRQNK